MSQTQITHMLSLLYSFFYLRHCASPFPGIILRSQLPSACIHCRHHKKRYALHSVQSCDVPSYADSIPQPHDNANESAFHISHICSDNHDDLRPVRQYIQSRHCFSHPLHIWQQFLLSPSYPTDDIPLWFQLLSPALENASGYHSLLHAVPNRFQNRLSISVICFVLYCCF